MMRGQQSMSTRAARTWGAPVAWRTAWARPGWGWMILLSASLPQLQNAAHFRVSNAIRIADAKPRAPFGV